MNVAELLFLMIAPLIAAGLTLWLRSKAPPEGTLLWPIGFFIVAGAGVFLAQSVGERDLASALLLGLCPIVTTLLAICPPAIRRRPWAVVAVMPALYALALLVAVNIGLETSLLSL